MAIKLSEHFNYIKLLKFTFPTMIMTICTSLYGVIDGTFVSNFAGSDSLAAVNIVWPIITLYGAIGIMVGSGGGALISKTLGEGKKQLAIRYFSMLIYFEIIIGILFSVVGFLTVELFAKLLGAEGIILEYGVSYGKILFITLPVFVLQNSFQNFMVAAERPKIGLLTSILAGIVNIFFDFLLIYVLEMGVKGAAIATGIGQCVGGLLPLFFFIFKNSTNYQLVITGFEIKPITKACSNGLSGMVLVMSISIVNMLYNYQLLKFIGPGGVISYGIVQYILYITLGFLTGYSHGTVPIVSFHYGAQNFDEIKNLFKRGLIIIFISSIVFFGLTECLAPVYAKIFVSYDDDLLKLTVHAIRIYYIFILFGGYNTLISTFFTGLNNGKVAAIISLSRTLLFDGGSILVLPLIFGAGSIWYSVTVAEAISLLIAGVILLINRKKYQYF